MFILAQLLLVSGLQLATHTASPVEKVVELINELKAKIEADGAVEQKIYDKFACWCEKTTQRKADSIDAGKKTIGTTTTEILTLKGAIAVLASEIAEHEANIAENNEQIKKATSIREKGNSDYQQEKAYMETALGSLHQAIEVLSGAGTGGDKATSYGLLKVASEVRSAVLGSPHLAALSEAQSKVLKKFLEDPSPFAFVQSEPSDYYDKKAQAKASYSPQSATVTGILKDMYDTFAADLERSNGDESSAQMNFEAVIDEKNRVNKIEQGLVTKKSAEKAEKSQSLAENEALLEATQAQLKEDEEFFATAQQSCKDKSDAWDERGRLRTEELKGIQEALTILTSDDARATFASATETRPTDTFGSEGVSFIQFEAEGLPRERAYRALKKALHGHKSLKLARLAATVRATAQGHFDDVIKAIDEMLQTLKDEESEDIKQRDWCIEETHVETSNRDDFAYDIAQLEAKIERAEVKKKGLESDKERTETDKENLQDDMAQALADRTAENTAFGDAKEDDLKAIGLLESAITALSKYGENNALIQQPVFDVSEDQAPDATFSSGDKHKGASDGIVALLTQIKENLENEVGLATKSEAKATEEYDALKASADAQIEAYDNQITDLDGSIAATDAEIKDDTNTKTDTEGEKTATEEYLAKIQPNCDWIRGAFEKRAAARKQESEGLQQAKSILAGSEGGDFGFLQKH
jgi:hypothetical protein